MPDYSKSIIYKLCCKDPSITDIYIGSTTNFIERKCSHKNCCINKNSKKYNMNVYKFIREHGDWDNWDMVQIEIYGVEKKRDLQTRERYWIEGLKSSLNSSIPTQTDLEYRQKNKEKVAKYYQTNKEYINKRKTIKVICECGSEFSKSYKKKHNESKKHLNFILI